MLLFSICEDFFPRILPLQKQTNLHTLMTDGCVCTFSSIECLIDMMQDR